MGTVLFPLVVIKFRSWCLMEVRLKIVMIQENQITSVFVIPSKLNWFVFTFPIKEKKICFEINPIFHFLLKGKYIGQDFVESGLTRGRFGRPLKSTDIQIGVFILYFPPCYPPKKYFNKFIDIGPCGTRSSRNNNNMNHVLALLFSLVQPSR